MNSRKPVRAHKVSTLESLVAGTLAGAIIGSMISLPYAAYKNDANIVAKAAIAGGSIGAYVGAGCPLP